MLEVKLTGHRYRTAKRQFTRHRRRAGPYFQQRSLGGWNGLSDYFQKHSLGAGAIVRVTVIFVSNGSGRIAYRFAAYEITGRQ